MKKLLKTLAVFLMVGMFLSGCSSSASGDDDNNKQPVILGTVADPVFSVEDNCYVDAGTTVELTCSTEGAEIYYTTDFCNPNKNYGKKYTGAIEINDATTIKAVAIKDNYNSSKVITVNVKVNGYSYEITNVEFYKDIGLSYNGTQLYDHIIDGYQITTDDIKAYGVKKVNGVEVFNGQIPSDEIVFSTKTKFNWHSAESTVNCTIVEPEDVVIYSKNASNHLVDKYVWNGKFNLEGNRYTIDELADDMKYFMSIGGKFSLNAIRDSDGTKYTYDKIYFGTYLYADNNAYTDKAKITSDELGYHYRQSLNLYDCGCGTLAKPLPIKKDTTIDESIINYTKEGYTIDIKVNIIFFTPNVSHETYPEKVYYDFVTNEIVMTK